MKNAFIISAIQSGAGKTTVSLALMALFKHHGLTVAPFKAGPDFIDPGLHRAVTGLHSRNLDRWMCGDTFVQAVFNKYTALSDVSIVEGVMGLFDGKERSSANLAKFLGIPVIVVLDCKGMAETVSAVLSGIEAFDKDVAVAGVILNRVGSRTHFERLKAAVESNCKSEVFGFIAASADIKIPERHLGLFTAEDSIIGSDFINNLVSLVKDTVDIDKILAKTSIEPVPSLINDNKNLPLHNHKLRLAVARDAAFCFYYEDNLELLRSFGIETVFFSPISDKELPEGTCGIYFGGGYPELYSEALSKNEYLRNRIREFSESGGVVYAECGGLMYISDGIKTTDGSFYPMCGVLPVKCEMRPKLSRLGYREVKLTEDTIIGHKGDILRGHEFHYSDIYENSSSIENIYENTEGAAGFFVKHTLASYVHLHFAGNPSFALKLATGMNLWYSR
ncbi:MAG: cobyrinate a,c-diamide synthase [Nitrospirae bacterium]|nr:cobyrinate a,c-diamide synthase [Nitrospirota bacterium]MBF0535398.1 cobyrinate a,c-diamide synthase [Nitrospirota bacterium]MBF0616918.1 cobyrinate a,c-diamide synthase [Nitrospirota bacterium]